MKAILAEQIGAFGLTGVTDPQRMVVFGRTESKTSRFWIDTDYQRIRIIHHRRTHA